MKKFRTVASVIIMVIAGIVGFFIGAFLNEPMAGTILFSMIAGIACIVYAIDNHEEEIDDSESKIAAKIDLERLFDLMSNKRYVMVIRELVLKEVEPEFLALSIGITVANLYNIKKRALAALAHLAMNDKKKYENKR